MSTNFKEKAIEKIANELKEFKGDRKETVISTHVAEVLTKFCEENERFAEILFRTPRTLSECCAEVMDGSGNAVSDIEVYRKAVQHYFPNSDIRVTMEIAFTGEAPSDEEIERAAKKKPKETKPPKAKPEKEKSSKPKPDAKPKAAQKSTPTPEVEHIQLTLF